MTHPSRRTFLRFLGGSSLLLGSRAWAQLESLGADSSGVLTEACHFDQLGGWSLDTQFFQQMGGVQLLAHGLGQPVANAKTKVNLPEPGRWRLLVRTRDWCPGEWEAPGRFQLRINGQDHPTIFGTEEGWAWQEGGWIELEGSEAEVELVDLTGFNARLDAIYLTRSETFVPPNDGAEIVRWKDAISGREDLDIERESFDLVVIGGGIAGCAASLAAARQGLRVALVQDRPLFGGNASEEVRVHTLGIHGKSEDLLRGIDTGKWPNGSHDAIQDQAKREATMASEDRITLMPGTIAYGVGQEGKRIVSVDVRDARSGITKRLEAPQFIDCSGDAWLGFWAGAEFREGRESKHEFNEVWDRHGELWSPEKPDNRVMGASLLWGSKREQAAVQFPEVPWALPVAAGNESIKGEWQWEYSSNELNQATDAEAIRDHMLRAIFGSFSNAKRKPQHAPVALDFVAFIAGKRESRRLVGDYLFKQQDAQSGEDFPDTVVEETREVDVHYQRSERGDARTFLSEALFLKTPKYHIPFRSLYSRNIPNLMMAGRCFSCTHIGLGGPRVMLTCGQMGVAVGHAAALCQEHEIDPREVGQQHIDELRKRIGYA